MPDTTFIYGLRETDSQHIRYVGKTVYPEKRFQQHLQKQTSPLVACWVEELAERGLEPEMVVLENVPRDPESMPWDGCMKSEEAEYRWSLQLASEGHDLLNAELAAARRRKAAEHINKDKIPRGIQLAT